MTVTRLTKRAVEQAEILPAEYTLWDDEVKGFGVRIRPSGKRVYIFKYRTVGGRQGKATIGPHGNLTVDQARGIAKKMALEVSQGGDPAGEKSALRAAPTVAALCERYMVQHAEAHKKARSADSDRSLIDNHVKPRLGRLQVHAVVRSHVTDIHHDMRTTPYQANRVLALLSKMFNLAEVWGMRPDGSNPCRHVKKYREEKRERFLSSAELARLSEVLTKDAPGLGVSASAIAAIRLLVLTGCRLSEILGLEWAWVDFEAGCLRLPDSKTGKKVVQLGAPALAILSTIKRQDGNPYVIVGQRTGSRLINLEKPWRLVRTKAGLGDVRLHDLRHTFASFGASANLSLPMIGKLLGHTQAQTTARYAHLATDPVKQSADTIANAIAAAMRGGEAEVVPLRRVGGENL